MNERYEKPRLDLDSIEELNYISTVEEDAIIDAHIEELREWGYGSISHVHDLHQLFWEFTRRGIILDKLFRVAVVECIEDEPLYTKFLGMTKRYNGWAQKYVTLEAKQKKSNNKELLDKTARIKELNENLKNANANIKKLEKEKEELVKAQKPKKAGAIENELRQELKKEYSRKLIELRQRTKSYKALTKVIMNGLMNPCSRFFESYDLTKQKDVDDYIGIFSIAGRKVNTATQKIIVKQYGGESDIPYFMTRVREYNEMWEQSHLGEDNNDDEKYL